MVRKVAGRGNQRGRAIETPHCQAGALAREGSRGHYREAKWLNKCQDEYIWIFVFFICTLNGTPCIKQAKMEEDFDSKRFIRKSRKNALY